MAKRTYKGACFLPDDVVWCDKRDDDPGALCVVLKTVRGGAHVDIEASDKSQRRVHASRLMMETPAPKS